MLTPSPPDGYREQFRNYVKLPLHTFVEFATEKLGQLKKMALSYSNHYLLRTGEFDRNGGVER